jgi:hypothetical protein
MTRQRGEEWRRFKAISLCMKICQSTIMVLWHISKVYKAFLKVLQCVWKVLLMHIKIW